MVLNTLHILTYFIPKSPVKVGTLISTVQMQKLGDGEIKYIAQGSMTSKLHKWRLNGGRQAADLGFNPSLTKSYTAL